jgi:hypothetical protein
MLRFTEVAQSLAPAPTIRSMGAINVLIAASEEGGPGIGVVWKAIGAVGVVVGLIAGIQQIATTLRRRRFSRAERRVLETVARALDAESAAEDVAKYEALRESLRRQVEDEVPLEARRVFLRTQIDHLRQRIGADVTEFERLRGQLARLEAQRVEPLDARLDEVVERAIRPPYAKRRGNETAILVMVSLLLVAALSPYEVGYVLFAAPEALTDSADESPADVGVAIAVGALAVFGIATALGNWFLRSRLRGIKTWPKLWLGSAAVVVIATALLVVGGLQSNRASTLFARAYAEDDPGGRLENRAERIDARAGSFLLAGTVSLGVSASLVLLCFSLERESRLLRRRVSA